jgi:hypothetical protein
MIVGDEELWKSEADDEESCYGGYEKDDFATAAVLVEVRVVLLER